MPILKYVPPHSEKKDCRTNYGGYYVAKCDYCGEEYYPKRRNSRYCSVTCIRMAYRSRILEVKRFSKPIYVYKFFKDRGFNVHGDKTSIIEILENMAIGEVIDDMFDGFAIKRHKHNLFIVKKVNS